jgi:hypothetical protein
MDALINIVDWCRQRRLLLQKQLDDLRAGKFRVVADTTSGQVDITPDNIKRVEDEIEELNRLIAEYEASGSVS